MQVTDHAGTVTTTQLGDGDQLDLTALADGPVQIQLTASDPCRTEVAHTESFVVDTTPPVITYTSPTPNGRIFDTDDLSTIAWSTDDGEHGSGVASQSMTFDGVGKTNGHVLDMFFLQPGTHTIVVTAADNLGNSGSSTRTFVVRATADSLARPSTPPPPTGSSPTEGPRRQRRLTSATNSARPRTGGALPLLATVRADRSANSPRSLPVKRP